MSLITEEPLFETMEALSKALRGAAIDRDWLKLDMPKVQTKGNLLDKVDLSKVDAVGFADLTPGSGHGSGGYSDVAWIEVYGKPVKRDTADQSR